METNQITDTLREVQQALSKLGQVLESAVRELKDKSEELRIVHDTNQRLTTENADLRKRGYELSDELAIARRETREQVNARSSVEGERDSLKLRLEEAEKECIRLREMVLNVAVAIEAAGLTPSKAMQAEAASARPTSSPSPVSEVTGSGSTSGSEATAGAGASDKTEQPRDNYGRYQSWNTETQQYEWKDRH